MITLLHVDPATPAANGTGRSIAQQVATALVVVALFLPQVVGGVYEAIQRPVPEAYPILCALSLVLSVTAWFASYSRQHQIPWVMDMGWFLLAAWIIIVPYYILRREGRAGLSRIGLFCLTWFAAWATGRAVGIWARVLVPFE